MIFKLACYGTFNGPMTAVVDARCHLVCQQLPFHIKKLQGQDADVVQIFQDTADHRVGFIPGVCGHGSRGC